MSKENWTPFAQQTHPGAQYANGNKIYSGPCADRQLVLNHQLQFVHNDYSLSSIQRSAAEHCSIDTGFVHPSIVFQKLLKKSTDELNEFRTQKNHAQQNLLNSQQRVDQLKNQLSYWRGYLVKLSVELPTNNIFLTCLENESLPVEISDCFLSRKQQQMKAEEIKLIDVRKKYLDCVFQLSQKENDHKRLNRQINNGHQ